MRIFISYSSTDRAEALSIQSWLEKNGWENDVFVDVDPEYGLSGGEAWRAALRNAAGRCEAVILLLSRAWLASKPCWSEFQLAEKFGKPCVPIRIDDAVALKDLPPEITNTYQVIEKVAALQAEFEVRLKRALEVAGAGPENFALPQGRRPYPGLESLKEVDAALLFGRDADVLAALDTLRDIRSTTRKRMMVLLGASGAGKSSLLRAGIWPRLNRDDRNFIVLPTVRPSNAILSGKEGLWQALETGLADPRRTMHLQSTTPRTRAAVRMAAERDPWVLISLFSDIRQAAQQSFLDKGANPPSIVLAVDQGEELFNPEGALEAEIFLRLLAPLWTDDPQFITLIAIRSDAYPQLQADLRIDQQQVRPFNLAPMPPAGLLQVIEGPAERVELEVDPALTAALLRDAQGADVLPLLAFTLERLFDERLDDKRLALTDYTRMGGVRGAIEVAAKKARSGAVATGVPEGSLDSLLRRTFLPHLVRVNEAGEFARKVAELSELDSECLPLVEVLVAQRLLISDQKGAVKTVEVAHEAILREWPLLRGWLDAERGFLEWRDQVGRARKLHERNEGDLLTGRALAVAQGFIETRQHSIGEPDRKFIEKSIAVEADRLKAEEAAREAQRLAELNAAKAREEAALAAAAAEKKLADAARRTTRNLRFFAGAMAILAALVGLAGYYALINGRTAKAEAQHAEEERQHATAEAQRAESEKQRATTEAARARTEAQRATAEADRATAAQKIADWSRMESESRRIALTAEAVRGASGDDKALALAWLALPHDAAMSYRPVTNEAASTIYSRTAQIMASMKNPVLTGFAPNGDFAVTVFGNGNAGLWDVRTQQVLLELSNVKTEFRATTADTDENDDTHQKDDAKQKKDRVSYGGYNERSLPLYFLNDGKTLVTLHDDDVIRSWDLTSKSRTPKFELPLLKNQVVQARFSSDGSYLYGIAADKSLFVWQLPSGKQVLNIRNKKFIGGEFSDGNTYFVGYVDLNSGTVYRLGDGHELFSIPEPKGKRTGYFKWRNTADSYFSEASARLLMVTAARDKDAYLWDLKTGRSIVKLVTENGESGYGDQFEFRFIGNGKLVLIAAAQSTLRGWLWDSATGKLVRRIEGYAGVTSKDGQDKIIRLVGGKVRISNLDDQDELQFGHDFNINRVADLQIDFEKGLAVVGGRSAETPSEIWDIKADVLVGSLERISTSGSGAGFRLSRDASAILTEGSDGDAKLWNEKSGVSLTTLVTENDNQVMDEALFGAGDDSVLVNWKADGKLGAKLAETTVWTLNRVWKLQLRSPARSAAFSPDGSRILITAEDNSARIWRVTGKAVAAELKGHTGTIVDADFSSDGLLVITGAWDSTAKIWDAATGALKFTLKGHASGVAHVAFSPDGKLALTASHDATARIWNAQTGALMKTLSGHKGSIVAASFSNDSRWILTASTDETAAIWDADTGARLATLAAHTGALTAARFSPDGTRVATASEDHTAMIWRTATGASLARLDAHGGMVTDVQWSPNGEALLTTSTDKTAILWDTSTFHSRGVLKGHLGAVTKGAFSPDGKQVATISSDQTLRLWDVQTAAQLATHVGHDKTIHKLVFRRDGRRIATVSSDGTARLWTVFPGSLSERIADVGRAIQKLHPLTKDECEQYGVVGLPGAETACLAD